LRAREARLALLDGVDPIDAKHEERLAKWLEVARSMTFRQCADDYIKAHAGAWKHAKHRSQWQTTLNTYAHPIVGPLPVAKIDTALVMKVLHPAWERAPDTANRLRVRI
jgi:hypothetical protein